MKAKNKPAFPVFDSPSKGDGLTKLEWFAGMALTGVISRLPDGNWPSEQVATMAFNAAEAMCAEAERRQKP